MSGGVNISFDENDDVVVNDIPDDLMEAIEERARANGQTVEDEMRDVLIELARRFEQRSGQSPLP